MTERKKKKAREHPESGEWGKVKYRRCKKKIDNERQRWRHYESSWCVKNVPFSAFKGREKVLNWRENERGVKIFRETRDFFFFTHEGGYSSTTFFLSVIRIKVSRQTKTRKENNYSKIKKV